MQPKDVDTPIAATYSLPEPLPLDSGAVLHGVTIAYQTSGTLNESRSNAILICHALTGDQYVTGTSPLTGKPGWWSGVVGAGKAIDTNKYFVICSNVLGSCLGSTGPGSINPATGAPYGLDFPTITIADMVRAQERLVCEHLGISKLLAVVGGSMGGMQVLQWAVSFPEKTRAVLALACSYRHTAQNIAFHEVGRQAIMADPDWRQGRYFEHGVRPTKGLAVARMTAHVTYMSARALQQKFGRNLQDRSAVSYGFDADFQVESYLRYQGSSFVERFDANSYLYMTRAVDYFDLSGDYGGILTRAFSPLPRYCIISLSSDWLFPPAEHKAIVKALNGIAANVSYVEIDTDRGHDAFLMDVPQLHAMIARYLDGSAAQFGIVS
ncbi:MAG: homoserine O-acetyltransferase [Thalassospira sp.]|nr:homoserine O-acetyltransferase [Thalassospira sp.]